MDIVSFDNIEFRAGKNGLEAVFMGYFALPLPEGELAKLGPYEIVDGGLVFRDVSAKKAQNKLSRLLGAEKLISTVTKKPVAYITRQSGIPLIGNAAFGIIDRNSSLIEVKPVTGCNMNCIFCSVDEGLATKKVSEILVEPHYLAEECRKVVEYKGVACQLTINAHGEPLTYGPMAELIGLLKQIQGVAFISLITNGTLLSKELIDSLARAGLDQLNFSLNAIDEKTAKMLEGHGLYDVNFVKDMARYAATKLKVLIAPVYVPGWNDAELKKLIEFAQEIKAEVGIQNFLPYKRGRNPVQGMALEEFYDKLRVLEKETGAKLIVDADEFGVVATKALPRPLRKGQKVRARIACNGRYPGEKIAVVGDRTVTVQKCQADAGSTITVQITGTKHNLFYGAQV